MKALKRTLALVLVLALSVSFFAFGASASFTDSSKIEYKDAVSILTGLGIIEGFEDGSFQPTGDVTRAQMAKLIAYALLGEDDAEDLTAKSDVFTDVSASHWAAGYILFCKNMGIIDGYGDGTFGPNDNVTGYQVAKMILCAVGYGQNDEFIGTNWTSSVSKKSLALDLFDGNLAGLNGSPATREEACLYLWNGLNLQTVTYDGDDGYTGITYKDDSNNVLAQSLGHKNYKIAVATGLLTANAATTAKYQADEDKDIDAKSVIGGTAYTIDTGLDLIGHTVKVYYKEGDVTTAYAVVDKTKLFKTITIGAAGDDKDARSEALADAGFKVDATATNASITVAVYTDYGTTTTNKTLADLAKGDSYIFLSNATDKTPKYAIKITEQLYKVDKLNATTEILTVKDYNNALKYIDYDDVVSDLTTIAKGDYVVGTQVNGTFWSFTVAKSVTGPVTGINAATDKLTVTISGTTYSPSTASLGTTNLNADAITDIGATITKKYITDENSTTLYLDSAGNYMMIVANEDSTDDSIAIVYSCQNKLSADSETTYVNSSYVNAVLLDGTKVSYKTSEDADDFSNYTGTASTAKASMPQTFMKVSVDSDGIATLTAILADGTVKSGSTAYYLDTVTAGASGKEIKSTDTSITGTNKNYLNSTTSYIFISWDATDKEYDIIEKTGGVNYDMAANSAAKVVSTVSSGNYIASAVLFGASFSDAGTSTDNILYFASVKQSGFSGYYQFAGYAADTGTKSTYTVKSVTGSAAAPTTSQTIDTTLALSGFYSYTIDADGYYSLKYKAASDDYVYGNTYASFYGNLITTTGSNDVDDGDFSSAVVVDTRSTANKKADNGYWKNAISSVSDIDAATENGYVVTLQILADTSDDNNDVLAIFVTSAVSKYALTVDGTNCWAKDSDNLISVIANTTTDTLAFGNEATATITVTTSAGVAKETSAVLAVGDIITIKGTTLPSYAIYTVGTVGAEPV
ncbi:MAG: S-layer homology domain-containing protein [Clostridia bacterium]|nr:S-layer homology domain-containing protein [Clostridia bacterium]